MVYNMTIHENLPTENKLKKKKERQKTKLTSFRTKNILILKLNIFFFIYVCVQDFGYFEWNCRKFVHIFFI